MSGARTFAVLCVACAVFVVAAGQGGVNIQCPDDQDENSTVVLHANPANCSTFYECDNGVAKLLACPADLYFSSKTQGCAYKKDSDCAKSLELDLPSVDVRVRSADDVDFKCPEDESNTTSVYYANQKNCSTFYECSNEIPVLMECPKRLYFNARMCVCTLPKNSHCTQPDDGDDGDDEFGIFAAFTDADWLQMRQHLVRVNSGKCYKDTL